MKRIVKSRQVVGKIVLEVLECGHLSEEHDVLKEGQSVPTFRSIRNCKLCDRREERRRGC